MDDKNCYPRRISPATFQTAEDAAQATQEESQKGQTADKSRYADFASSFAAFISVHSRVGDPDARDHLELIRETLRHRGLPESEIQGKNERAFWRSASTALLHTPKD